MIEIISSATCPFAQRTRMVLLEKGIDHELIEINLDDKPDWFLAISPYGKVPVVRHEDAVIFESAVINEYLEDVFPDKPLLPNESILRAHARIWIDFANVRFVPYIYKLMLAQDHNAQKHLKLKLTEALLMVEHDALKKRTSGPYWLGDQVSLVDLTFYPHMQRFCALEHYREYQIPEECILLQNWLDIMAQLPCVKKLKVSEDTYIRNWRKYAENTSTGTTAADMRDF